MYKFRLVFLFLTFLLVLASSNCSSPSKQQTDLTIITKQKITVKPEAAQYLTDIYPIAITSPNKQIIGLPNLSTPTGVILIDYEGNFITRVGAEGRGPGELLDNRYLGMDEQNNVVVNDRKLKMITRFDLADDTAYTYKEAFPEGTYTSSKRFSLCGDKWYIALNDLSGGSTENSPLVGIFDTNFQVEKTFGTFDPYLKGNRSVLQSPKIALDCRNQLVYATHAKVPYIQVYDLTNFTRIARTTTIPPSFKLSEEFIGMVTDSRRMREFMTEEQSVNSFIALTEKYIITPFRHSTDKFYKTRNYVDREQFLAVYSREDYTFLGEIPIEGAPLASTKEGYLVILKNDNPDNFQLELIEVVPRDS